MDSDNSNNKFTLNRSLSFSGSPISQKVCVEQSFQNKRGETLIRQYSCQQIYDCSNTTPTVQYKKSVFLQSPRKLRNSLIPSLENNLISSSLINLSPINNFQTELERFPFSAQTSNLFNFHKNCPEQKAFEQSLMQNRSNREEKIQECTPMDVDTSIEDYPMPDVHSPFTLKGDNEVDNNEEHRTKVSKMNISPSRVEKRDLNNEEQKTYTRIFVKYFKLFTVLLIPIACAFILMHSDVFISEDNYMSDNFQSENITNALQELLYGQQEVVAKIKESLNYVDDKNLIVFIGGVGVGKTYSANIISNNFQWKDNIIKIVSPQHKNVYHETNSVRSLSQIGYNLVIIDNLELDDKQSVIPFVKKVFGTDKKIILILIYTIPKFSYDTSEELDLISSSIQIRESLTEAKIKHSLVVFNKLNADDVRKCIRYAIAKKGLIINHHNIEHVLQNVNYEYSGCKGVYTKVALLR